jgi:hypothetical protein
MHRKSILTNLTRTENSSNKDNPLVAVNAPGISCAIPVNGIEKPTKFNPMYGLNRMARAMHPLLK